MTHSWRAEPEAVAVAVDGAGRVYTVGTSGNWQRQRALLRAYRPDGTLRWERRWRPAGGELYARDVSVGPKGMIVVTGRVKLADPPKGCDEIWNGGWAIRAWRPDGTTRWQRTQAGWRACRVFATSGTSVAARGRTVAMAIGIVDEYSTSARIRSFDLQGRRRWERPFTVPGSENELIDGVAVGGGGAVYLAATSHVITLDSPVRDQDALLVKLRPDGSTAWRRTVPDRSSGAGTDHDYGTSVAAIRGGVVFGAVLDEPTGPARARVARYGATGRLRWERHAPGAYLRPSTGWWHDAFVGVWAGGPVLAGSEFDADGRGTHVTLRGYDGIGTQRWRIRLGPETDQAWGVTGFGVADRTIVAGGRPAFAAGRWSRVWRLSG